MREGKKSGREKKISNVYLGTQRETAILFFWKGRYGGIMQRNSRLQDFAWG